MRAAPRREGSGGRRENRSSRIQSKNPAACPARRPEPKRGSQVMNRKNYSKLVLGMLVVGFALL
ncbi:MAG: hypothetical protein K8H90_02395, partial [Thermoanaerobaculia bacterium]|nr:hypothetical protein [Thermoanaerobaculia bacterium]